MGCQATHAHATRRNVYIRKATAWKCYRGFGAPMRRAANGEIECMSHNHKDCLWGGHCTLRKKRDNGRNLACGVHHSQKWGGTGYDSVRHWCSKLNKIIPAQSDAHNRRMAARRAMLARNARRLKAKRALALTARRAAHARHMRARRAAHARRMRAIRVAKAKALAAKGRAAFLKRMKDHRAAAHARRMKALRARRAAHARRMKAIRVAKAKALAAKRRAAHLK